MLSVHPTVAGEPDRNIHPSVSAYQIPANTNDRAGSDLRHTPNEFSVCFKAAETINELIYVFNVTFLPSLY